MFHVIVGKLYRHVKDELLCFLNFPLILYGADVCRSSTVLLHNALPFVGFGFLDNCIMIVAVSLLACCGVAGLQASPGNQTLALWCDCRQIWKKPYCSLRVSTFDVGILLFAHSFLLRLKSVENLNPVEYSEFISLIQCLNSVAVYKDYIWGSL